MNQEEERPSQGKESDHPSLDTIVDQQDFLETEDGDAKMELEEKD
jgi:hypothetical protein